LTAEQLEATIPGAYGSIFDILQHIVTSEQSHFSRISTGQPRRRATDGRPMTMAEMAEPLRTTGYCLIEWAPKVHADDMVQVD
jgi:hypothetical protein